MKAHRVCIAVAAALYLGSGAALPQAPMEADERVDPSERVRGAAVIVEPRAAEGAPAQVVRAALAHALARAGAAAMLIPSDKPHRMLYTSAFGFYPAARCQSCRSRGRMCCSYGGSWPASRFA